jgi:hypothetical protein
MTHKVLIPSYSRFFPSKEQREVAAKANREFNVDSFDTYNDWFYFIHINPAQRLLHAFGMFTGFSFFFRSIIELNIIYFFIGTFFFYFLGLISHFIYDKATARSGPKHFLSTLWPVIRINLHTSFGIYDKSLRAFVEKYPFVSNIHDLQEVPKKNVISYLLK